MVNDQTCMFEGGGGGEGIKYVCDENKEHALHKEE